MRQRKREMFTIYKNNSGFSMMELMIVLATLGILAGIAMTSLIASRSRVMDAAALSETHLLGKAVLNAFIDGKVVDLAHGEGGGPAIGTPPIFTLSDDMEAIITGNSDWNSTGLGKCEAEVWHPGGTKRYWLIIDEEAEITDFPTS